VASFFSATCAPRVTKDGPLVGGGVWEGMCSACQVGGLLIDFHERCVSVRVWRAGCRFSFHSQDQQHAQLLPLKPPVKDLNIHPQINPTPTSNETTPHRVIVQRLVPMATTREHCAA